MAQYRLLDYLPEIWQEIKEMVAHASAEDAELKSMSEAVNVAYADQFLYTMTESGISRWEKMLGIMPMGTDTLEDRRFRVINRVNAQLPYTFNMLKAHLAQMCGTNGFEMSYNASTWTLTIKIGLESKKQYTEVVNLALEMIPANLLLFVGYLYNTYRGLHKYTHENLANYTYQGVRDEPISI